jgi:glycosyltransferase involved in cell wall biosynthesis
MFSMVHQRLSVVYLTAGAGGMYCGSCLRDNALARGLARLGCDVQLIPTYTPIRTDEEDVSEPRVFFGGINVFLQQKSALARHMPRFLDRWLDKPSLLRRVASGHIPIDAAVLGDLAVSMLAGEDGRQRKEVARLIDYLAGAGASVINLTNMLIAGCVPAIKRRLNVPVVVTLQGDDVFLDSLPESHRQAAISHIERLGRQVDAFITFSRDYADRMAQSLGLARERFHIVPLGVEAEDFGASSAGGDGGRKGPPLTVGYLARHSPAKGFHVLVEAFIRLRSRPGMENVRLRSAGWLGESDRRYFDEQMAKLYAADMSGDYEYAGVVDRRGKIEFLRGLDVLSVPTTMREPKGLYVLEALASGVPVVEPNHGAFPELLAATGGGELCAPGDAASLADALESLLGDADRRRALGEAGREAVRRSFTTEVMARATLEVYQRLCSRAGCAGRTPSFLP